jgi:site-specific recombinase XerD
MISSESSQLIARYVNDFRPRLCQSPGNWLFPGMDGRPKHSGKFSEQISAYIERATGMHLTSLGLRYFAGAIYLLSHPNDHEVVRQALGHKSLATTRQMYRDLDTMLAVSRFDNVVLRPL